MICLALLASAGWAQEQDQGQSQGETDKKPAEPVKPGLYTTVDEHSIYLIIDGKQYDLQTGESAYVDKTKKFESLGQTPDFVEWPCGTSYAMNRGNLPTYSIDDLPREGRIKEIVRRYFEETRLPEGHPLFANGEYHGKFPASEIEALVSDAWWYHAGPKDGPMAFRRPKVLIISLFWGTGQVVVDTHFLKDLEAYYGDQDIPVIFEFREEYEVPMSYFGARPSLDELMQAFSERGIRVADVPMYWAGDNHMSIDTATLANRLDLPPLDKMDPKRLAKLQEDLRANGFSRKPITLAMTPGGDKLLVDEGERIRAAQSLGIESIPVMFAFYTASAHASLCGLPPPSTAVGSLGTSNQQSTVASGPARPPEIELPNPPQPENPASGN